MKIEEIIKNNYPNDILVVVDKTINEINIKHNGRYHYIYNHDELETKKVSINIESNLNVDILEYHVISKENDEAKISINFLISNNSVVNYNAINNDCLLKTNKSLTFDLLENSVLNTYILELGNNTHSQYNINLKEPRSCADFNLMVYADQGIFQHHNVNINHLNEYTTSNMNNHGVITDVSNCEFDVTSFIKKGSIKSNAYQTSKILTLSDKCTSKINPQLLIDEHDVVGGHAATSGRVSEEIMYYMQSRGIEKNLVNKLIAIGNLSKNIPVSLIETLTQVLERRLDHE
ncbi:MAG: SufD family Fe-S cluster assembly protein [Bacilli bacterium]|nr:SufD family Fe-S cluster assembly protein [Bacilli bacterium]MDD4547582.1 SufD family Fe-S cluster assembly protein [Bacilli bacterium]